MRIGLLIRALTVGGAERQLVGLARALRAEGLGVSVLVLYRAGNFLEEELAAAGVPLVHLRKRGRWDIPGFFGRLRSAARELELDVVYSFLPTANVLAAILWGDGGSRGPAVVWGVRGADAVGAGHDWLGRALVRAQDFLAGRADAVIANSGPGIDACRARGWPPGQLHLVPNGLDGTVFDFDATARERLRKDWGVAEGQPVIGTAGRLDPVKGLEDFLPAVARVLVVQPAARAVVAGDGAPGYAATLRAQAEGLGLAAALRWLGPVRDMAAFYSAVDLVCVPSRSEGCSNVVAEALACGTPVVATRVGDNALYLEDASRLAEPADPGALADAMLCALAPPAPESRAARRRIILDQLAVPRLVRQTITVLEGAVGRRRSRPAAG